MNEQSGPVAGVCDLRQCHPAEPPLMLWKSVLHNTVATSYMWLRSPQAVASVTEGLNFKLCGIFTKNSENCHG